MRSILEDEEEETRRADTEITLGMKSLLGVFFGAVLVCGVFFGFGYSMGRGNGHGAVPAASTIPASGTVLKQSVTGDTAATSSPSAESGESGAEASEATGASGSEAVPASIESASTPAPSTSGSKGSGYDYVATPDGPARRPADAPAAANRAPKPSAAVEQAEAKTAGALEAVPAPAAAPHAQAASLTTSTAVAGAGPIMVQIAAVSRTEDASILVGALKKHGYSATMRSDPRDNLVHVQLGPFATRDEARAMRSRLMADGYNAILK